MREEVLAAIRARITEATETGDSQPVLEQDALVEADALLARVLEPAVDPGEPPDVEALHAIGWLYWLRATALPPDEAEDDLELAVMLLEQVYDADPAAVPERLRIVYEELTPQQHTAPRRRRRRKPRRVDPAEYTDQGANLFRWYEQTGDLDALQAAIRSFRAAVAAVPDNHPKRGTCLSNLHTAVYSLAERTDDLDALRGAVNLGRAALAATPDGDPEHAERLYSLSTTLCSLGERTGGVDALREAVGLGRAALAATPDGDPEHAECLTGLGIALQSLFEHIGDVDLLREVVLLGRAAVAATPDGDPGQAGRLSNLGGALQTLFEHTGDPELQREAVTAGQAAVAALPDDHPDRATCLSNLGASLRVSFDQTGDLGTLYEAARVGRAAVAATPDGSPDQATYLSNLGGALETLFEHTGDLDTLREAVTVGRAAVAATPARHPHHAMFLANLGVSVRILFERTGDLDMLREAVGALRAAVAATPDGHPNRASRLVNLGNTLRVVYDRTGDLNALRDAIAAGRAAVATTPDGHVQHAGNLSNLGLSLHVLFERTGDLDTLRDAVAAARAALAVTPGDHPHHARYLSNLAIGLHLLLEQTGDPGTLREAVAYGRAAVAATPDGHPELSSYLFGLGTALRDAFERTGEQQALPEARAVFARAAGLLTAAVTDRISAGQGQARVDALAGDRPSALAAMESVISLLPQLAPRELRRADREHRLGEVAGVGAHAAAAALSAGRPERAVELLEQARGLLLAETMDARADHARLRAHAPDLADEFTRLRDHLASLETAPSQGVHALSAEVSGQDSAAWAIQQDNVRQLADQRREAAAQWNALLVRICAHPALADFLTPHAIGRLQRHADAGPIVIVSTDADRCDALILTADPDQPVRHVPLTDLTQGVAYKQAGLFLTARRAASAGNSLTERQDAQSALHQILGWLWDTTAEPVLAALGYTGTPPAGQPWPRLWWCPVGGMAYLPLHAAGHHNDVATHVAHPRTVLDRVASSYTATIRALAYARRVPASPAPTTERRPALIVAMPDTPDATSLPGVLDEAQRLTCLLPGATVLNGRRATHDAVVAALPAHSVAHFACHGISDWAAPDTSRLLLHDHTSNPLTVAAVSRLHLTGADLAYLSACSTTDTRPNLADEAVHITAAFQLAGYRNVIGTLWPVNDQTATRIADDFYSRLTGHGTHPPHTDQSAIALHHAVRCLRTDYLATPTRWAAHIHTGT